MIGVTETFVTHLIELRYRLLKIVIGIFISVIVFLPFSNELYTILAKPLMNRLPEGGHMIATAVTSSFLIPIKVSTMAGIIASLPYSLYQIWAFVAPGLYANERKFVAPLILVSTLLFITGMAFSYFIVFPVLFGFIATSAPHGVVVMTDIASYLDFVITMFLSFGIAFELPILVVILIKYNLVQMKTLLAMRPYVIVAAFIVGAILTPPDVISQVMLAIPLCLLYEIGILVSKLIKPRVSIG